MSARRRFALVASTAALPIVMATVINPQVKKHTGAAIFDTQLRLSAEGMREQLPRFSPAARRWARGFYALDMAFPALAGVLLRGAIATGLRWHHPHGPITAGGRLFLLSPLVMTTLDWGENLAALVAIHGQGSVREMAIRTHLVARRSKLSVAALTVPALAVLLISGATSRRRRH